MKQKKEFSFDITALAGARFGVYRKLTKKYGVDKKHRLKYLLSGLISAVCTLFGFLDQLIFAFKAKPKNTKDPVFILGHWRSGTTFLHNLLCLDPQTGFTTTYQTVFPNNLFSFQWLFKFFLKKLMPPERPVDGVSLHADFPQEEEFALNNEYEFSFYNWWYFPKKTREIANEYLFEETAKSKDIEKWSENYKRFVNRSLLNTQGQRFVSKNPPNTARIKHLLKLYPNAKFIFIDRNPYEVVQSTLAFYKGVLEGIKLQDIDDETLLSDIFWVYKKLMKKYEEDKKLIPAKNLVEIRYADLISHPAETVKTIYTQLMQDDFSRVEKPLNQYLAKQKHALKDYSYQANYLKRVNSELLEVFETQGYEMR